MRDALRSVIYHDKFHAGLWLDKFFPGGEGEAKGNHIERLTHTAIPDGYRQAFDRWKASLIGGGGLVAEARVDGRMVIGLGEKSALEMGLTVHHTWGVPTIPGSGLKGIAAAVAHRLLNDEGWRRPPAEPDEDAEVNSHEMLFGSLRRQGVVRFHDAWWVPEGTRLPLYPDVMTVHHPEYYQPSPEQASSPSDTDSPNPVSFVSVNGTYLIALEGPAAWCAAAMELLRIGMQEFGVGGKTNAGYGRLSLGEAEDHRPMTPERWFEEQHAALAALDGKGQYEGLVALQGKDAAGSVFGELSPQTCKALLDKRLREGVAYARVVASGGDKDDAAATLKADLARHEQARPSKKDKKAYESWKKQEAKLLRQIAGAEGRGKGDARRMEEAEALLAWLKEA